ncbi:NAD(P)H-hydrate dehydratase [Oryzibacter oryziterrae]|uniref:NAD(P)H-hydrate dehydratase n=1 Tax=Oryzibacter oryziterrae TaxID=2766474 RepID=UPI001F02B67E|nr:NAD(P)H-hydrate dehydratase [Oryzibacter oryziterrae]
MQTKDHIGRAALLSPEEMAEADRLAIADGTDGFTLMERAGYAVADEICRQFSQGTRAAVLCGRGNNGGDGFVVAQVLKERGFVVRLGFVGEAEGGIATLKGDARRAALAWRGDTEPASEGLFAKARVIVDALYGAGLSRDLNGADALLVAAMNAARDRGARVFAVDLPSGIDGASGAVRGVAVNADTTITFFRRKPGHLLLPGRIHCGRVVLADIGISPAVIDKIAPKVSANGPDLWRDDWPQPAVDSHKFSRGAALVASGPLYGCGAARLVAEAALRVGAGIVTVAAPPDAAPVIAAGRAALVVKPFATAEDFARLTSDRRLRAIVVGPGLGLERKAGDAVDLALNSDAAIVLDADGITLKASDPASAFQNFKSRSAVTVLTPHEGEFARLFPDIKGNKLFRAREAARMSGAIVLLKGPDTVIAAPDGRAAINENAPPTLAVAGSGDVLAGIIGGLLASGLPGFEAACLGAWIHGRAGQIAGPGSLADEIAGAVRQVMAEGAPPPPDIDD